MKQTFETYQNEVKSTIDQFRKDVNKIRNSDNPYYANSKEVQDYEIGKLRNALDETVKQLNKDYKAKANEAVAQAKEAAARSTFNVTDSDRKQASSALNDFVTDAMLSVGDSAKDEAFHALQRKLNYFGENELAALKEQLPNYLQKLGDDRSMKNARQLKGTLSNLQTEEEAYLEEAHHYAQATIDQRHKTLKKTNAEYKGSPGNTHGGAAIGQAYSLSELGEQEEARIRGQERQNRF